MFGNGTAGIELSERERALSNAVMDAWGEFARTGKPTWPAYTARAAHEVIDLAWSTAPEPDCRLWDQLE